MRSGRPNVSMTPEREIGKSGSARGRRERERERDRKEFELRMEIMFEKIPALVRTYVEVGAGPRPLQMIDPAQGQAGNLLLTNRAENSSGSGAAVRPSGSASATREASLETPAPRSTADQTQPPMAGEVHQSKPESPSGSAEGSRQEGVGADASDVPLGSSP